MKFNEQLKAYLEEIPASQKELAEKSGLSPATISRYLSGEREPDAQSVPVDMLSGALSELAQEHGAKVRSPGEIAADLNGTLPEGLTGDYDIFLATLNHLLKHLEIRTSDLARYLHHDASHISKILSGSRRPGNIRLFIGEIADYIAHRFSNSSNLPYLAKLINTDAEELSSPAVLREKLIAWLGSNTQVETDDSIPRFLTQMDTFDLNDYLKAVRYEDIRIPPSAPRLPIRREYTGIKNMMQAELDFMKATVLSRAADDCIFFSDMPIEEMAADPDFPGKYMIGMAMLLKKGLHLHIIHDLNRPFPEMMLGLESWIPLYMTGQISPYYFPSPQNQIFLHFLKVSGSAALEGSAVAGRQGEGKYVLYRSREDVGHYRRRAAGLLEKASPLMDIYNKSQMNAYHAALKTVFAERNIEMICSGLPVFFLPEELLFRVLERIRPDRSEKDAVIAYYRDFRQTVLRFLEEHTCRLVIPAFDPSLTGENAPHLSLADVFAEKQPALTQQEYQACLEALQQMCRDYPSLSFCQDPQPTFRNINITISGSQTVIVSKEKSPAIHFVIHHKKMIRAFQNFIPPIVEN